MAIHTQKAKQKTFNSSASNSDIHRVLKDRQSSELVIALCGPLGCGINNSVPILKKVLAKDGHHVEHIRISTLMKHAIRHKASLAKLVKELPADDDIGFNRYDKLQNTGDKIRQYVNTSVLAKFAIEDIGVRRNENHESMLNTAQADTRTAYIVDQLKYCGCN